MSRKINIEVAYFEPGKPFLVSLSVVPPTTVAEAIQASGVLDRFPSLAGGDDLEVGIFSRRAALDTELSEGDRVEIYRPLQVDPKQARRLRAAAKKKRQAG